MPKRPPASKPTGGTRKSQTVERAGLVLACFSASKPQLTLAELAEQLELNQSTVYRYALALQGAGLLERDERRGGYRLGLRVVELAGIVLNQLEVRKQALDEMDHLRDDLDLDVSLGVLFEGDVLILAQSFRKDLPALYTGMGRRQPAHSSGMGKLLLAQLSDADALAIVEQYGWRPMTDKSIGTPEGLYDALRATRQHGYAVANEEVRLGIFGLAYPVRDFSGEVKAALGVTGRFPLLEDAQRERVLARLQVAANRISFRLGFHDEGPYR
jgi:DNA-binding IclR family transcriptional regulator